MKKYFDALGLQTDASKEEIKKAYKRLAKKYHPDINHSDDAESKFKEISEAYRILTGNDHKPEIFNGFAGYDDFFNYRSRKRSYSPEEKFAARIGLDLYVSASLTLSEAFSGVTKKIPVKRHHICDTCSGTGSKDGLLGVCPLCNGTGMQVKSKGFLTISMTCPNCGGSGSVVTENCIDCNGSGLIAEEESMEIKFPPGISEEISIRVGGKGNVFGKRVGDVYVSASINKMEGIKRIGDNLHVDLTIPVLSAILGDEVSVNDFYGSTKINIPAGTQQNYSVKLKGYGMPIVGKPGKRGDAIIQFKIEIPKRLTKKEREIYESLRSAGNSSR